MIRRDDSFVKPMVSINADILPAESIGGIVLGSELGHVLEALSEVRAKSVDRRFSNFGQEYQEVTVPDYGITVIGDSTGTVIRVSCAKPYEGRYRRRYFPGMSIIQLQEIANKTLVIHGMIVVDNEFGVAFDFPEVFRDECFDDVDFISQLPDEMPVTEIHVLDREWWRN